MYRIPQKTGEYFNARRPMRIKATTTGLQAAESDRDREIEGSREEATHCRVITKEKKKTDCAPAGFLRRYGQKQAAIFNTVQLCYLSHLHQPKTRRRKELVIGRDACMVVCVPRSCRADNTQTRLAQCTHVSCSRLKSPKLLSL